MLLKSSCLECHIDANWIKWCHLALLTTELWCGNCLAPQLCHFFWLLFDVWGRQKRRWKFTCFLKTEISSSFIFRVLIDTYSPQFLLCWTVWTWKRSVFRCLLWIRANQVENSCPQSCESGIHLHLVKMARCQQHTWELRGQWSVSGAVMWQGDGRVVPMCSLCTPDLTDWGWPWQNLCLLVKLCFQHLRNWAICLRCQD